MAVLRPIVPKMGETCFKLVEQIGPLARKFADRLEKQVLDCEFTLPCLGDLVWLVFINHAGERFR